LSQRLRRIPTKSAVARNPFATERVKSTMTKSPPIPTVDAIPTNVPLPMDADDMTEVASSGSGKKRQETREISLNWCIEGATDRQQAKKIQNKVLFMMLKTFANEVTALDQTNQELQWDSHQKEKEFQQILTKAKFQCFSAPSIRETQLRRWYCVHKIITTVSLSTLKRHPNVLEKIKENKVYINEHHFNTETWDVAHIGFLQGLNIKHIHRNEAKRQIQAQLALNNAEHPNFELVSVRVRSGQKQTAFHQTRAYEVQCARSDAKALAKMLTSGPFRQTMIFVPYAFKKRQPEAFLQAIMNQNKELADTWIVKLQGLTDIILEEIRPIIMSQPGVKAIVPTHNGQDKGQWKILVSQKKFAAFRRWLGTQWNTITKNLTEETLASIPETHPPMIITSADTGDNDDDSTGEESYATAFTNAMSVITTDTFTGSVQDSNTKDNNRNPAPPSFAEVLRNPSPISTVTYGSNGGRGTLPGPQPRHQHTPGYHQVKGKNTTELEDQLKLMASESKVLKEKIETLVQTVQKQAEQTESLQQMLAQIMTIQNEQQIYGPPTPQRRKIDFNVAINAETEAFNADKNQHHQK